MMKIFISATLMFLLAYRSFAVDVKEFGAKGDGKADDTEAIRAAVKGSPDGSLEFPDGTYRVTSTIEIDLSQTGRIRITGNGTARIIMEGEGPAFFFRGSHDGSAAYESVSETTWEKERMPVIESIEIAGANPSADGLRFDRCFMPVLRSVLIRDVRNGIHFTERQRNIIISGCHVYHCSGIGIYIDSVNIHQMIIGDSHISYCKSGGIKVRRSEIRNFQVTGNDIEYNYDPEKDESADFWLDCSLGGSVREGTISGNTIQALVSPGGANILFRGNPSDPKTIGLWSITGNQISNQETNIKLENTRGISISGNTFIIARNRSIVIENSENIVAGSNVFDHNQDYFRNEKGKGSIYVSGSKHVILSNNIIEKGTFGDEKSGGAITVMKSSYVSINGCQIYDSGFRGIQLHNTVNSQVINCLINDTKKSMLSAIDVSGSCQGTVISGNQYNEGTSGGITGNIKGLEVRNNFVIK